MEPTATTLPPARPLRVAFVAAECEPWAKTGGLADVVDALARALGAVGVGAIETPVDVFLPRYGGIDVPADRVLGERRLFVRDPASPRRRIGVRLIDVAANGYRLRLVDHPRSFGRSGYYGEGGADYPDNAARFTLLCLVAIRALADEGRPPDVLHLHDWHAAPVAILRDGALRGEPTLRDAAVILTVHNFAYHGWTPLDRVGALGLAPGDGILATDATGVDLLAEGVDRADLVNTVSPGFAREALLPGGGHGLESRLVAKGDRFLGILNGLDMELWDPATDPALAATYDRADRAGKVACRADLLRRVGMDPDDGGPVLGMIGRLDPQKGFDILAAAAPTLLDRGFRLVVQGSGMPELAAGIRSLVARRPRGIAFIEAFDRDLARRIYAGSDGFLMPSRFEPCGTGQMVALRYGTPPIVHATGGLVDTVVDEGDHPGAGTGFAFRHPTPEGLLWACDEFARCRADPPAWTALVERGMAAALAFDWRTGSAPAYIGAYRRAVEIRRARGGTLGSVPG